MGTTCPPVTDSLPIPYDGSQTVLFDDHNLDGTMGAFATSPGVTAGDPASLTVWLGPDFTTNVGPIDLAVPFEGHRFAIGDRNTESVGRLGVAAGLGSVPTALNSGINGTGHHPQDDNGGPVAPGVSESNDLEARADSTTDRSSSCVRYQT